MILPTAKGYHQNKKKESKRRERKERGKSYQKNSIVTCIECQIRVSPGTNAHVIILVRREIPGLCEPERNCTKAAYHR